MKTIVRRSSKEGKCHTLICQRYDAPRAHHPQETEITIRAPSSHSLIPCLSTVGEAKGLRNARSLGLKVIIKVVPVAVGGVVVL